MRRGGKPKPDTPYQELRIWRTVFALVFAVFAPFAAVLLYVEFRRLFLPVAAGGGGSYPEVLALVLATAATVTSLIGVVSTNVRMWKHERLEKIQRELEIERMQLEIEKIRRDLGHKQLPSIQGGDSDLTSDE